MPVLHRAIAAVAITTLVLSLIFVTRDIASNSPVAIPASTPRVAAKKVAPLKAIAVSTKPAHTVTKVIAKGGQHTLPVPPKKRNL
jgi:hypothetical protein